GIHRVQVLDFDGMPELMRGVLYVRMRMKHRDGDGVVVFTNPVLRFCHRMMAHSIAGRSQAPEKLSILDSMGLTVTTPALPIIDCRSVLGLETLGLGDPHDLLGKRAPMAPGGGDEDEERPQAVLPPPNT
nr:hypothetical protein [Tanacetum cinerariifolium]